MKTIVIIGLGALGSHLLMFSRNFPARFVLVDFDRVEQKNLQSQFHTRMTNGKNKAQGMAQAMQGMWGMRNVRPNPNKLTADNIEQLLRGADCVVDCVDNGPTRRLIQQYVRKHDTPCLHGALSGDGTLGRAVWDDIFTIDDAAEGAATACENEDHLPFIAFTASIMARVLQMWVDNGTQRSLDVLGSGQTVRIG